MVICIYWLVLYVRFAIWMKIQYIIKYVCSLLGFERKGKFKTGWVKAADTCICVMGVSMMCIC